MTVTYTDKWYIDAKTFIFFEGRWTRDVQDRLFRVKSSQRFPVRYPLIIQQGKYYDFNLKGNGLYPDNPFTLYELGFGLEGNGLLHVMIPSDKYYNVLEKPEFVPADDLSVNKYVGGYTEDEIPVDEPRRLRVYTLKDMITVVYRIMADSYEDEKIVLHVTVNRLKLVEPSDEERKRVEEEWDEMLRKGTLVVLESWELR